MPISVSCHNPLCARKSIMTIVVNFYPVEYSKTSRQQNRGDNGEKPMGFKKHPPPFPSLSQT